jgi:hypothetical protein
MLRRPKLADPCSENGRCVLHGRVWRVSINVRSTETDMAPCTCDDGGVAVDRRRRPISIGGGCDAAVSAVRLSPGRPLFALCYRLLRTTLPRITRFAPFPPVSSRCARSCRRSVSLSKSTTEKTHETRCRVGSLASFSSLYYEGVYRIFI